MGVAWVWHGACELNTVALCKAEATLEPEPTQHSKPTFVWTYIARHVWLHLSLRLHWSQN